MGENNNDISLRDLMNAINRIDDKYDRRFERMEDDMDRVKAFQNKALGILAVFSSFIAIGSGYVWNKVVGKS